MLYRRGSLCFHFIVEPNGQITNKKILKGISSKEHCNADKEAMKVLEFLTEWTPGRMSREQKYQLRFLYQLDSP